MRWMLASAVTSITIAPTVNDSNATVAYLDESAVAISDADTNTTGHQVALGVGETVINVVVTAGDSTATYTLTVTRAMPPPPPPAAVLVSNTGQARENGQNVGNVNGNQGQYAQKFTTGSNPGGYILNDVIISLDNAQANAMPVITIRAASGNGNNPLDTVLYTLTTPADLDFVLTTFGAPAGATLDSDTSYFVVMQNANTANTSAARYSVSTTLADGEDSGALAGWSIANTARVKKRFGRLEYLWCQPGLPHTAPGIRNRPAADRCVVGQHHDRNPFHTGRGVA